MRREYNFLIFRLNRQRGLPLHAQGILDFSLFCDVSLGITPACAGNTATTSSIGVVDRDYPCMRREYLQKSNHIVYFTGLPLHAQGILKICQHFFSLVGITPACAGNTQAKEHLNLEPWDYPCMRREYFDLPVDFD